MWDSSSAIWAFGRNAIDEKGVYWRGVIISNGARLLVGDRASARAAVLQMQECLPGPLYCSGASALALSLPSERAEWISHIVDIELVLRALSRSRRVHRRGREALSTSVLARILWFTGGEDIDLSDREGLIEGRYDCGEVSDEALLRVLQGLIQFLHDSAERNGELDRIQKYEVPASRVLLSQSRHVIQLDGLGASQVANESIPRLERLRNKIYLETECDPEDLAASPSMRAKLLCANQIEVVDGAYGSTFQQFLDLATISGRPGLVEVGEYWVLRRQVNALLTVAQYGDEGGHPLFDAIGTSTSRILMRSPQLQWLAKRDRGRVRPRDGYSLIYLDYQSFEPAILAILSDDDELTSACESGLYGSIAQWMDVPVSESSVKFFKVFFLCFLYGRSRARLAEDLAEFCQEDGDVAVQRIQRLEARIPRAIAFRTRIEEEARSTGIAKTLVGVHRRLAKDRAYVALSHFLQGTGALVFKAALVRAFSAVPEMYLIAPMHDGIVAEVPTSIRSDAVSHVAEAMRDASAEVLGKSIPAVEATWGD